MNIKTIHKSELVGLNITEVFSSSLWLQIYEDIPLVYLGIFNKNQELIGFCYYQKHKRAKFLTHVSPPFLSPTCGLFLKEESTNPANRNTFFKKVNEAISDYLNQQKYDILSLPFPEKYGDMQSYLWAGYKVSPKYTYQLDLLQSEEDLLKSMSGERRKNIIKSQKDGLTVRESFGNKASHQLILQTFVKQGLWYDKQVLKNIFANFTSTSNAIAYSTYQDEKLLATVFCVRDEQKTYYILGGFDSDSIHSGAGAFAMWHSIIRAKELGCQIFDFEGSMHPPIEKYFRGFGGKMIPYYAITKQNWRGKALLKIRKK